MAKKRHRWAHSLSGTRKVRDLSITSCKDCGCVKQYLKGEVTYFMNDSIYFFAPNCNPDNPNRE